MKKMLTSALSAIVCISCLSANMAVFAETSEPALLIESDKFTCMKKTEQSDPVLIIHDDAFQNDIYIVAGVMRDTTTGEPVEYFIYDCNATTIPANRSTGWWWAGEAESLFGRELAIGDVISCSEFFAQETYPPRLFIENRINEYKEDPDAYLETHNSAPYAKYLGKGTELYGDDFKYVVCEVCSGMYEMITFASGDSKWYCNSWYKDMNLTVDYGDANADGKVNIMDVINVNRNIMIGAPLTAYGTLAADVNKDGVVDAVDSLNMLKGVVGLVDFAELQ